MIIGKSCTEKKPESDPRKNLRILITRIALVLIVIFAAAVVYRNGSNWLDQLVELPWSLSPFLLAGSSLILLVSLWLTPEGWIRLSLFLGSTAQRSELRSAWFVSQLGRYIPGKIWLFAGRTGYLKTRGLSLSRSILSTVLEMIFTAGAVGAVCFLTVWWISGSEMSSHVRITVILAGACLVLIPVLNPSLRLLLKTRRKVSDEIDKFRLPVVFSLKILLLYTFIWLFRGFALYLWITGFGLKTTGIWTVLFAVPLSWLAGYIVFFVPGGVGVREAVIVSFLAYSGQVGPFLVVVFGHRILLGLFELLLASPSLKKFPLNRTGKVT